jgi:hypothetical protein
MLSAAEGGRAVLVELSVMEQRYHAVMEVVSGAPVTEVARRYGVSRRIRCRRPTWHAVSIQACD